jgi:hypothetical protein
LEYDVTVHDEEVFASCERGRCLAYGTRERCTFRVSKLEESQAKLEMVHDMLHEGLHLRGLALANEEGSEARGGSRVAFAAISHASYVVVVNVEVGLNGVCGRVGTRDHIVIVVVVLRKMWFGDWSDHGLSHGFAWL